MKVQYSRGVALSREGEQYPELQDCGWRRGLPATGDDRFLPQRKSRGCRSSRANKGRKVEREKKSSHTLFFIALQKISSNAEGRSLLHFIGSKTTIY